LFDDASDDPRVLIVRDDTSWKGRNTKVFYQRAFLTRGIKFAEGSDQTELRDLVKSYSIKLLGSKLKPKNKQFAVGVLKVEFPTSPDAEEFYSESDKAFFQRCRDVLSEEVALLSAFLDGDWFSSGTQQTENEFARLLTTVVTLSLITKDEKPEFWEHVIEYITQHPEVKNQFHAAVQQRLELEEFPEKELMERAKRVAKSLPEEIMKILVGEGLRFLISR
jgi:hypothetical protein